VIRKKMRRESEIFIANGKIFGDSNNEYLVKRKPRNLLGQAWDVV